MLIGHDETEALDELEMLIETAGASAAGRMTQSEQYGHPATYFGTGKLRELSLMVAETGADGIVCDDELSSSQMANLSRELQCKVLDRTLLILDIFAGRAVTMEGKLQVELAQQKYRASHLIGLGKELSRQGGGIGTRGPGEKKLESDKRRIRERITRLKSELAEVRKHRGIRRERREKNGMLTAALVGYTSAGKSTLLNALTDADILTDAMLFSTLDTTTRTLCLPSGRHILLTDTVGFIRKLPHDLIEAFRGTLEEIGEADVIIHVVDEADRLVEQKMRTVYETLRTLGISGQPVMTVFNKADLLREFSEDFPGDVFFKDGYEGGNDILAAGAREMPRDIRADVSVRVSAKSGQGLSHMTEMLEEMLRDHMVYVEEVIPYADGSRLARIRREGTIVEEAYTEAGVCVKAYIPKSLL